MNSKSKRYFVEEDGKLPPPDKIDTVDDFPRTISPQPNMEETHQNSSVNKSYRARRHFSNPKGSNDESLKEALKIDGLATTFQQRKVYKRRKQYEFVAEHSKRATILLPDDGGIIEASPGESTCTLSQREISQSVDIASSSKHFSLDLKQFGPYHIDYTNNGKYLLLGGKRGHVAAFDWFTKNLLCEINVLEAVRDVKWLHNELMYAVAQKRYTYIYDHQGVELHCLKMLNDVLRLDFLPYHFLLAASCANSFLHWVDVSIGKLVVSYPSKAGALNVMRQNPANAVLHCGQSLGLVSLWSPNVKEPLVKMVCHHGPVKSLDIDRTGNYMATSGSDKLVKIWDLRTFKPLFEYKFMRNAENLAFSQRKLLGCSVGSDIQIFKDVCYQAAESPYLMHRLTEPSDDLQFCPFEDVLGVGHRSGFTSLLVPGAGEPNVDVYAANPYRSKNQRREAEVKGLLDKIQPEMITLNTDLISRLDQNVAGQALKEKLEFMYKKRVSNDEIHLKNKAKGKSSSSNLQKRKQVVRTARQKILIHEQSKIRKELTDVGILESVDKAPKRDFNNGSVLDRFKRAVTN